MAEPNLNNFIADLMAEDFNLLQIVANGGSDEYSSLSQKKLYDAIWFFDKRHAATVVDYIRREMDIDDQNKVMSRLAQLYPLSQNIVLRMLQSLPKTTDGLREGFDLGKEVLGEISANIILISKNSGKITREFENYAKEIERKKTDIKKYEEIIAKDTSYAREKKELDTKIKALMEEASKDNKQKVLDAKHQEIERLKKEKEDLIAKNKEAETIRSKLKKEIKECEGKLEKTSEKESLRSLLELFPKDVEEN